MHWTLLKIWEAQLRTSWQADEIVVTRGEALIDHLPAYEIDRVTLVHAGAGDSPVEVRAAIFELPDRVVVLDAASGVTGRVLFERQSYWAQRNCIYWLSDRCVSWPEGQGDARRRMGRHVPSYRSLTPAAAGALLERSDVTGPHTWDQRKQYRIERRRLFPGRAVATAPTQLSAMT